MSLRYSIQNIKGKIVTKNYKNFPYSYDPFVIHKKNYKSTDRILYSDRLKSWNPEHFQACHQAVWNDSVTQFHHHSLTEIEQFLTLYLEHQIQCTGVEQACNISNGYPYWIFYIRDQE